MANHKILAPFIRYYEGGFVNDKDDPGGATNKGVTLTTFRQVFGKNKTVTDLRNITGDQWNTIFKKYYWDKCKADRISNQSIADMFVDFAWHSGLGNAVPIMQKVAGLHNQDGIVGDITLTAINTYPNQKALFESLKKARMDFLKGRKMWWKYGKGWTNRVSAIGYGSLAYNGKTVNF